MHEIIHLINTTSLIQYWRIDDDVQAILNYHRIYSGLASLGRSSSLSHTLLRPLYVFRTVGVTISSVHGHGRLFPRIHRDVGSFGASRGDGAFAARPAHCRFLRPREDDNKITRGQRHQHQQSGLECLEQTRRIIKIFCNFISCTYTYVEFYEQGAGVNGVTAHDAAVAYEISS